MSGQDSSGFYRAGDGIQIEALATKTVVRNIDELPSFDPLPGITMSILSGARSMANWVKLDPSVEVPAHRHPHEQLGLVLEGEIQMTIDGKTQTLSPGHCYVIAGDVEHAAVAGPNGCLVLDIFSPPREDYREAAGA